MKKMTRLLALCLSVLLIGGLTGCVSVSIEPYGATGTVRGEGEIVETNFPVGEFSGVRVNTSVDIVYRQGDCSVSMTMHENLAQYMEFSVEEDILIVSTSKFFQTGLGEGPVLYLSAPVLKDVRIMGASDLITEDPIAGEHFYLELSGSSEAELDLDVNTFKVVTAGASDLELSGRADTFVANNSGSSNISAFALNTKQTYLVVTGSADIDVFCSDLLDVNISGAGSVRYKGDPQINRSITGAGSVRAAFE